jgi:hypothetical protein
LPNAIAYICRRVQDHDGGKSVRKVGVNVTDPPQLTVKAV